MYSEILAKAISELPDDYQETGMISGSKLAYCPLVAILKMIGIEVEFDEYTKGKFLRGHDLEKRIIQLLFLSPDHQIKEGEWIKSKNGSKIYSQYEPIGYRGTTGSIDLLEDCGHEYIIHEFKSCTKLAWDAVAGRGKSLWAYRKRTGDKDGYPKPAPKKHHEMQLALYGLAKWDKPVRCMLHYLNADDYRLISFEVNPQEHKNAIDNQIDTILQAFITKQFPTYVSLWGWDKGKYNSYIDYEELSSAQIANKLREENKEAFDKFMHAKVVSDTIIYSAS